MLNIAIVPVSPGEPSAHSPTDLHALLRLLLTTHRELTEVAADQAQHLRALLLGGGDADHALSRSALSQGALYALACRNPPGDATDSQMARHAEIQRLCQVIIASRDALSANREQMETVVNDLAPGITAQPGTGPFKAAKAILENRRAQTIT